MAQKASGKKGVPENVCIFGESPSENGSFLKRSEKTAAQAPAATRLCRPRNATNKVRACALVSLYIRLPSHPLKREDQSGSLLNEKAAKPHHRKPRHIEGKVSTQSTERG